MLKEIKYKYTQKDISLKLISTTTAKAMTANNNGTIHLIFRELIELLLTWRVFHKNPSSIHDSICRQTSPENIRAKNSSCINYQCFIIT